MKPLHAAALVLIAFGLLVVARRALASTIEAITPTVYDEFGAEVDLPNDAADTLEAVLASVDPSSYMVGDVDDMTAANNVSAFLGMIAWAEGTDNFHGYNTLYGGGRFDDMSDHPRRPITARLGGKLITSTAAGRYQFLARTWDGLRDKLGLPDFGPDSQDRGAIELIRQRGALADVQAGRFDAAVQKCRREWASLPGSDYGQPNQRIEDLRAVFLRQGGVFA